MNRSDTHHPVIGLIESYLKRHRKPLGVSLDTELMHLDLDSLDLINLIVEMETDLGVPVSFLEELLLVGRPTVRELIRAYDCKAAAAVSA